MKCKLLIGILVVLVCGIMLMSNVTASGWPPVWINQATLSIVDSNPSLDPENSGFGTTQVVVWEEWNGVDWDIWMKYSLADGALLSWVFPNVHPATTSLNEINPAVAVSRLHPSTGQEIHVVYQRWNPGLAQWDICHTWTNTFGAAWTVPVVVSTDDAKDPAIVYTEDLLSPLPATPGMLMQIVWAEEILTTPGTYEINYTAYYWNPMVAPPRGYVPKTTIQTPPVGDTCDYPEIASVDENDPLRVPAVDFDFAVVWQETTAAGQMNVWYNDGTTTTSPGAPVTIIIGAGQISPVLIVAGDDCKEPDIAATQDYQAPGQTHYFQVNWVYDKAARPGPPPTPRTWSIESCYVAGAGPLPGWAALAAGGVNPSAVSRPNIMLDRPTIASKLTSLNPSVFETWMCWEDMTVTPGLTPPDIWFRVGQYTVGAPAFLYTWPAARVGYVSLGPDWEHNPELWNRNEALRQFPPLTHLVFDLSPIPVPPPPPPPPLGMPDIIYIDP